MPTNVTSASTFAQAATAGLTYSYKLAEDLEMAIMDRLGDSAIQFMGEPIDLSGQGSATKRMGILSNVSYQRVFTASGGETTLNAASGYTLDYWAASVAQYDLSFTQSVQAGVLGLPGVTVTLEDLVRFMPDNWLATLRGLLCTAASSFSDQTVGSASVAMNADDIFDAAAAATRKLGANVLGAPRMFLDPEQFITARDSFRSEPSYVQNLGAMQQIQRIQAGQDLGDVFGLGFTVSLTDSIVQGSGAYKGFMGSVGSVRRVVADPARAVIPAGVSPMVMPEGILVYDLLQAANAATFGKQALCFTGAAQGSATSSLQILVTSKV